MVGVNSCSTSPQRCTTGNSRTAPSSSGKRALTPKSRRWPSSSSPLSQLSTVGPSDSSGTSMLVSQSGTDTGIGFTTLSGMVTSRSSMGRPSQTEVTRKLKRNTLSGVTAPPSGMLTLAAAGTAAPTIKPARATERTARRGVGIRDMGLSPSAAGREPIVRRPIREPPSGCCCRLACRSAGQKAHEPRGYIASASSRRRPTHFSSSTATNGMGVTSSTTSSSVADRAVVAKIGCNSGT